MGRLDSTVGGGRLSGTLSGTSSGFSEDQLEQLVDRYGLPPLEKREPLNVLDKLGRILNVGTATIAGGIRGALREDESVLGGAAKGLLSAVDTRFKSLSFGDIIREDLGIKPEDQAGKFGVGTVGFIADVLFDPLTYLTFGLGVGVKIGGKVLTKGGTKLAQQASREIIENRIAKGATRQLAGQGVKGVVNDLVQRSFGKKGLTDEAAEQFLKEGISENTITTLRELGPKLLDQGGIKFFGKTLVTSKTLARTPLGKAAKRLGEQEIVVALKNTLGKTFIPDFLKNPQLVNGLEKAQREQRKAMEGIVEMNKELFKDLNDDEMSTLFSEIFKKKKEIPLNAADIQTKTIAELNKLFPDVKIKSADDAARVMDQLEDNTSKVMGGLQEKIDFFTKEFLEDIRTKIKEKTIRQPNLIVTAGTRIAKVKEYSEIERLDDFIKNFSQVIKDLKKEYYKVAKPVVKSVGTKKPFFTGDIQKEELIGVHNKILKEEEDRLEDIKQSLIDQHDQLKKSVELAKKQGVKRDVVKRAPGQNAKAFSPQEHVTIIQQQMRQLQNDLADKNRLLESIINARRDAKKKQKKEKLVFSDPKLQAVSDKLFEGDDAIVPRFAKLAGIDEEDMIKFYIPSFFRDRLMIKDFSVGRNLSSPQYGWLKQFTGVEDDLIKEPFEAYSRGQVAITTARIKLNAFSSLINSIGSKIEVGGWDKVTRKMPDGVMEGWFPKEISEEINKFLDPKKMGTIDELAKVTGFDWATGIFKAYVTSLFPAFYIRNIISNQFLNMMKIGLDTANPSFQYKALQIALGKNPEGVFKAKTGREFTNKKIRSLIEKESDILQDRAGAFSSLEVFLENPDNFGRLTNFNPLSRNFVVLQKGRQLGTIAESQAKIVGVLQALNEGKSVKEGIKQAEEALFNYSKLTDFERSVMRRMMPFYTFARKNAEYQIKLLASNPGRVATQMKAIKGIGTAFGEPITDEDKESLPNWIIDSLGIKAGANQYGQDTFLIGLGLPIEEFIQRFSGEHGIVWNTVQSTLVSTNPLIRFPLESATGQDFFRKKPIADIANAEDLKGLFSVLPEPVAKEMKDLIQFREIKNQPVYVGGKIVDRQSRYVANPFVLHWLRNLPTSRIQSTAGFLTDEDEAQYTKWLRLFTGVRGYSIDQEYTKFKKELDRKRELQDYLIRMGVLKRFENVYVPKAK